MAHTPLTSPIAQILEALPTPRLAELCRELGKVALADDPRAALTETLREAFENQLSKKKSPSELLLSQLSVPELRMIALEFGVNSAGAQREPLEARILVEVASAGSAPPDRAASPPPDLPVEVWLEKQRSTAAKEVDLTERSRTDRGDRRLRAAMWGLLFLPFGAIVFSTFLEALTLAWGVAVIAAVIYTRRSSRGEAGLLAVLEIAIRGCFFAPLFSYLGVGIGGMMVASLCVLEILCAIVMAIDAASAATANFKARIELKELLPTSRDARESSNSSQPPAPDRKPPQSPQETEGTPETEAATGIDPFHRGG